jgi:hypothetical protein
MKNLTLAEQYIKVAQFFTHLSQEHLLQSGAIKVIELESPTVIFPKDPLIAEKGPAGSVDTTMCRFTMYQFNDGSVIWYVKQSGDSYLQLRGIYNSEFRHTHYLKAGDEVREYTDDGSKNYPLIWDKEIHHLDIPVRIENCLKAENIYYIGQLVPFGKDQMLKFINMGRKSVDDLLEAMDRLGLKPETDTSNWKSPATH